MQKELSFKYYLLPVCFPLFGLNTAFAGIMGEYNVPANNSDKLHIYMSAGPAFAKLKNNTTVAINSVVANNYLPQQQTRWEGFWGGGVGHSFGNLFNAPLSFSLGVAAYTIDFGNIYGVEYPFASGGVFDTLNYQFAAKSTTVMVEGRAFYTACTWQPFALVGIGASWNFLSNYNELPTSTASSATPIVPNFGNRTISEFAYELGVGVQHQLFENIAHSVRYVAAVDYRYVNFGEGRLLSFPAQTIADSLKITNLSTQGLIFTLKAAFS